MTWLVRHSTGGRGMAREYLQEIRQPPESCLSAGVLGIRSMKTPCSDIDFIQPN